MSSLAWRGLAHQVLTIVAKDATQITAQQVGISAAATATGWCSMPYARTPWPALGDTFPGLSHQIEIGGLTRDGWCRKDWIGGAWPYLGGISSLAMQVAIPTTTQDQPMQATTYLRWLGETNSGSQPATFCSISFCSGDGFFTNISQMYVPFWHQSTFVIVGVHQLNCQVLIPTKAISLLKMQYLLEFNGTKLAPSQCYLSSVPLINLTKAFPMQINHCGKKPIGFQYRKRPF